MVPCKLHLILFCLWNTARHIQVILYVLFYFLVTGHWAGPQQNGWLILVCSIFLLIYLFLLLARVDSKARHAHKSGGRTHSYTVVLFSLCTAEPEKSNTFPRIWVCWSGKSISKPSFFPTFPLVLAAKDYPTLDWSAFLCTWECMHRVAVWVTLFPSPAGTFVYPATNNVSLFLLFGGCFFPQSI